MSEPYPIRVARTEEELQAVYRLRYEVYVEEMGYRWPYSDDSARVMPNPPGDVSTVLYVPDGDRAVGTLRMQLGRDGGLTEEDYKVYHLARFTPHVPPERMAILTRYMIREDFRHTDFAERLFDEMIRCLLDAGVQLAFCDCRPHLINTYLRLGFRPYAQTYNDPVAGLLVPLVMVLDDHAYFQRVKSRLTPLLHGRPRDPDLPARLATAIPASGPIQTLTDVQQWQDWMDILPVLNESDDDFVPLFDDISPDEIARIVASGNVITCAEGDRIIAQDHADHCMFVVLQGTVEVVKDNEVVALLPRGSVIGELSFLLKRPRTADVYADTDDVEILCLRGKNLTDLIESESSLAARLLYNLSRIIAQRLAAD
jgi:predicted GNAT family N-acyltransferase